MRGNYKKLTDMMVNNILAVYTGVMKLMAEQ